jgi:hypothetical protein
MAVLAEEPHFGNLLAAPALNAIASGHSYSGFAIAQAG